MLEWQRDPVAAGSSAFFRVGYEALAISSCRRLPAAVRRHSPLVVAFRHAGGRQDHQVLADVARVQADADGELVSGGRLPLGQKPRNLLAGVGVAG